MDSNAASGCLVQGAAVRRPTGRSRAGRRCPDQRDGWPAASSSAPVAGSPSRHQRVGSFPRRRADAICSDRDGRRGGRLRRAGSFRHPRGAGPCLPVLATSTDRPDRGGEACCRCMEGASKRRRRPRARAVAGCSHLCRCRRRPVGARVRSVCCARPGNRCRLLVLHHASDRLDLKQIPRGPSDP